MVAKDRGVFMLKPHRSAHRVLVVSVAASLLIVTAPAVDAVEDQPQVGFASGETPVTLEPDLVDIFLANADGTGLVNLTAGYGSYWPWAWSPDGSRIAFFSRDGTTDKVYVRDLDEAEPFVVAVGPDPELGGPIWSPDGTRIAFVSSQDGNAEVYVADVATRTARNVSNDPWESSGPHWSPTGTHISYEVRPGGEEVDIFVVSVSGGSPVNVSDDPAWSPMGSWSPDGSRFLFVSNREGNDEIYLAEVDGRNPVRLTNSPAHDRGPVWSPDGSRIAYSSGLDVRIEGTTTWQIVIPSRIWVMNADGSGRRALTNGSIDPDPNSSLGASVAHASPTWSPDGSRLIFAVTLTGSGPHQRFFTVYVVNPATRGPAVELWDGGGGWQARWSPDSARLAIRSTGNYGVDSTTVIANTDGSGTPLVLTGGVGSGSAGWSTYGTHLAYMNSGGVEPGDTVFVATPDGTAPVDITAGLTGPLNGAASWRPQRLGPVGLVDPETGLWHLDDGWGFVTSFYYGNPGDYPFVGDWDCDGIDTPGLYRQSDGFVYLRNSNTQGIADIRFFFGNPGDIPLPGDFNGDGCDTVSIYRPSEARFYIINALGANDGGLGAAEFSYIFGNPGDKPFVGDFDGDGTDTVGLHRESTGFVYFRQSHTQGMADSEFFFGDPGDRLVAGDWGVVDGVDTPAIFRPSNATFHYRHTNTQGVADSQSTWGQSDWLPVSGSFGLG
jgi:Tol biopolymer transport system component